MIRVNGIPLELVQPEILRLKVFEPILILGKEKFANLDIRVRVKGGGHTSQIYGKSIVFICDSHPSSYSKVHRCLQPKVC